MKKKITKMNFRDRARWFIYVTVLCSLALMINASPKPVQNLTPYSRIDQNTLGLEGLIDNDGVDHTGGIVIIISPNGKPSEHCFDSWTDYKAIIIHPDGDGVLILSISLTAGADISPGKRFQVIEQSACNGKYRLALQAI